MFQSPQSRVQGTVVSVIIVFVYDFFRFRFMSFFIFFRFSFHYFSFLFSLTKITLYRGKGSLQASRLTQFFLLRKVNKKSDVLHQTLSKTAWSVPRDHFKTVSKYNL